MTEAALQDSISSTPREMAEQAMNPDFWRELAPNFTVEGDVDPHILEFTEEEAKALVAKMDKEAYVHLVQPGMNSSFEEMQELLKKITDLGLPAVFAFAYDEFWHTHMQIRNFIKILLGDEFAMLPDFWCWRVEPGESGWTPHRDKVSGSLFPDGKPKSITVWIPLSITHPLNGCMYILPADRDRIYYNDGQNGFESRLPDIRALPGEAGDVFAWTQRVFHWGSHSAENHDLPPRQSVAFEYQRCDVKAFNSPLLDPDTRPDFKARMALIAKQILQYTHMYDFTPELEQMARTIKAEFGLPEATGKSL
jgi:hypothetical protein